MNLEDFQTIKVSRRLNPEALETCGWPGSQRGHPLSALASVWVHVWMNMTADGVNGCRVSRQVGARNVVRAPFSWTPLVKLLLRDITGRLAKTICYVGCWSKPTKIKKKQHYIAESKMISFFLFETSAITALWFAGFFFSIEAPFLLSQQEPYLVDKSLWFSILVAN